MKEAEMKKEYSVNQDDMTKDIGSNRIIGKLPESVRSFEVTFEGENNILYIAEDIKGIKNTKLRFKGDNALVYWSSNVNSYVMDCEIASGATVYIAKNVYMHGVEPLMIRLEEGENLYIGEDSMVSLQVIMDTEGKGDIFIGNHVWVGQKVRISGGSKVASGVILGALAVVSGERLNKNTCYITRDGMIQPILENVVFEKRSIRNTPAREMGKYSAIDPEYLKSIDLLIEDDRESFAEGLRSIDGAEDRMKYLHGKKGFLDRFKKPKAAKWIPPKDFRPLPAPSLGENIIEGPFDENEGSKVVFKGKGNRLVIEEGASLHNCKITFQGDNALLYLSKSNAPYSFIASMQADNTVFFGEGTKTSQTGKRLRLAPAEAKNLVVGEDVEFGKDIWLRNSDQHAMFSRETLARINPPKSVAIGSGAVLKDHDLVMKGRKVNVGEKDERLLKLMENLDSVTGMEERLSIIADYRKDA